MERHAIDRWADTTVFRVALMLASLGVFPVLLLGVVITLFGVGKVLAYGWPGKLEAPAVAMVVLSVGGACGVLGYLRAHIGLSEPRRHNVTVTLVLLVAGVLTATAVGGAVMVAVLESGLGFASSSHVYGLAGLFAAANLVWAFAGIARMQRLLCRYRAATGVAFDGLPVVLLCVALALATAAIAITATL